MEHLRYPEDLFKVQRYQYARYHVTDPSQWFQGNDRWEVPEDPNNNNNLQPPYRMFTNEPIPEGEPVPAVPEQTWSLTSTFVPFDRNTLAAYVSVDSDATSDTYGQMRVIDVLDDQTQGPGQVANAMRSDSSAADLLAPFRQAGNSVTYGNVLTIPVGERLLNVEPVYAERGAGTTGSYPILRYVLVSYNENVGIGETLIEALGAALGVDASAEPDDPAVPGDDPPPDDPGTPTGTVEEQIGAPPRPGPGALRRGRRGPQPGPARPRHSTRRRSTRPATRSRTPSSSPTPRTAPAPTEEPSPSEEASPSE